MPHNTMTFQDTVRPGSSSDGCSSVERCFADFHIDERSLLEILVTADGGHSDYMSGFVSGYSEQKPPLCRELASMRPARGRALSAAHLYMPRVWRHRVRILLSANSQILC